MDHFISDYVSVENNGHPVLITAAEFAQIMKVSKRTLWRLLSAGKLVEPIRVGGNTRWRLDDVRLWIDEGCPPPANPN